MANKSVETNHPAPPFNAGRQFEGTPCFSSLSCRREWYCIDLFDLILHDMFATLFLMSDFTVMLNSATLGNGRSAQALLPLVYEELRRLAYARMSMESPDHTLQPTALVHEAWLRMVNNTDRDWRNRAYFFSAAATAMRRILIDHARRKCAIKHGGGMQRLDLDSMDEAMLDMEVPGVNEKILMVDEALNQLEEVYPQWAKVVVMKYFGGMTDKEIAEALNIGDRTVRRYWSCAKAWLYDRMSTQD